MTATFNQAIQSGTETFTLKTAAGTAVAGSVSYNSTTNTATFAPTAALAYGTIYTATISGAKNSAGVAMTAAVAWSFTTDATQPAVSSHTPASGATGVAVSTAPTAVFNEAVQSGSITFTLATSAGTSVAGTFSYSSTTNTATFRAGDGTGVLDHLHGNRVSGAAKDTAGDPMSGSTSWSFTTAAATSGGPISIWSSTATPGTPADSEAASLELGVKFYSSVSGSITGIRFYKSTTNTGTHVADFWTSTGTLLATATFTSETASGWQQVNFATPVSITAGTTYVASYHTSVGHYADDQNYFTTAYNSGSLHVPANGGVYGYGNAGTFPTQVWNASNYWVDIVLAPSGLGAAAMSQATGTTVLGTLDTSTFTTATPTNATDSSTASNASPVGAPDSATSSAGDLPNDALPDAFIDILARDVIQSKQRRSTARV